MSYQSKFTGAEIDTLLSSISGNLKSVTPLLSEETILANSTIALSDNIKNYDFLLVNTFVKNSTLDTNIYKKTVFIYKDNIVGGNADEFAVYATADSSAGAYWYVVRFGFSEDGNSLLTSYIKKGSSWNSNDIGIENIYGIKLSQAISAGSATNPIGSILPVMGTEAPQDYLICDGRELQISEYKELADYFEKQFGDNGYFGGDGIKTFKLPDLRNEFLRGYGDLSGEIGIHQDATTHLNLFVGGDNVLILDAQPSAGMAINQDGDTGVDMTGNSRNYYYIDKTNQDDNSYGGIPTFYKSRPTNVAVLYCIKYTESASGTNAGENYSTEEQRIGTWIDGKPIYRKVYTYTITSTPVRSSIVIEKDFGLDKQMKKIYGNVYGESGDWSATYTLGLYHYWKDTTDVFSFLPNVENNDLILFTQWSVTQNFTVEMVVEYTKTTD